MEFNDTFITHLWYAGVLEFVAAIASHKKNDGLLTAAETATLTVYKSVLAYVCSSFFELLQLSCLFDAYMIDKNRRHEIEKWLKDRQYTTNIWDKMAYFPSVSLQRQCCHFTKDGKADQNRCI